jgi:hypothetical protein
VLFPTDRPAITVHHADGQDEVQIEPCGDELAQFEAIMADQPHQPNELAAAPANEATGMSPNLSFDEAFADAVAKLPQSVPSHPDSMTTVTVVDIRGLFGGIAGFHHLAVRIRGGSD